VKANPDLALENTSEYCYHCHQIADAIKTLTDVKDVSKVIQVLKTAPNNTQTSFVQIGEKLVEESEGAKQHGD